MSKTEAPPFGFPKFPVVCKASAPGSATGRSFAPTPGLIEAWTRLSASLPIWQYPRRSVATKMNMRLDYDTQRAGRKVFLEGGMANIGSWGMRGREWAPGVRWNCPALLPGRDGPRIFPHLGLPGFSRGGGESRAENQSRSGDCRACGREEERNVSGDSASGGAFFPFPGKRARSFIGAVEKALLRSGLTFAFARHSGLEPESIFAFVFGLSPGHPHFRPGKIRTPPYMSASSVPHSGATLSPANRNQMRKRKQKS